MHGAQHRKKKSQQKFGGLNPGKYPTTDLYILGPLITFYFEMGVPFSCLS